MKEFPFVEKGGAEPEMLQAQQRRDQEAWARAQGRAGNGLKSHSCMGCNSNVPRSPQKGGLEYNPIVILLTNAILMENPRGASMCTAVTFIPKRLWTAIGGIRSGGDGGDWLLFLS